MKSHEKFLQYWKGLYNSLSFYLVMKCEVGGLGPRHSYVRFNVNQLQYTVEGKCDFWQAKMWFAACLFLTHTDQLGLE